MKNMKKVASLGVAATLVAGGLVVTPAFAAGNDSEPDLKAALKQNVPVNVEIPEGAKQLPSDPSLKEVKDPKVKLEAPKVKPEAPKVKPEGKAPYDRHDQGMRPGEETTKALDLFKLDHPDANFPTPPIGTKNPNKVNDLLNAYEAVNNNVKATIKGKKAEAKKAEDKKVAKTSDKKGQKTSAKSGHLAKTGVATGALAGLAGLLGAAGVAAVRRSRRA